MGRKNPSVTTPLIYYGAETLSGTAVCSGRTERGPEHSGKYQSAPILENTFQRKSIRIRPYAPFPEIFFRLLGKQPELHITQIIQEQQDESEIYGSSLAS